MHLAECFREDISCVLTPACRLRGVLSNAFQAFLESLDQHSLEDIIEPRDELKRLLGIPEPIGLRTT